MRFNIICLMSIITMSACQESSKESSGLVFPTGVTPPHVQKLAKEFTLHGEKRVDEYYWLNERDNPKVIE